MRTNIKKFVLSLFTSILLVVGIAPMASATTNSNGASVSVSSQSMGQAKVTNLGIIGEAPMLINGATQVTWMRPDHRAGVTPRIAKRLMKKRAVRVNPDMTSQQLRAKTRGAKFVRVIGPWKNYGMNGTIKVPFIVNSDGGMIMEWDAGLGIYEHAATIKAPSQVKKDDKVLGSFKIGKRKLVITKSCYNDFGGAGTPVPVVEVTEITYGGKAVADAEALVNLGLSISCPNGTNITVSAGAKATGHAEASVQFTAPNRNAALSQSGVAAQAIKNLSVDTQAVANAQAKVVCGGNTPVQPVDHKPVVNIMGSPAHLYTGGNAYVWIEASDPDGDPVSVKVSAAGGGTVSGLVPVAVRWDGTPCPVGKTCYRAQVWAGQQAGSMTVTATVSANGLNGDPDSATWPIVADEF